VPPAHYLLGLVKSKPTAALPWTSRCGGSGRLIGHIGRYRMRRPGAAW